MMSATIKRADAFCARFGLRVPILLAPMAGASGPSLSIAVANAGGLGSCGVLLMQPDEIIAWANEVRSKSNDAFQLNNWISDPPPHRDRAHEARVRDFLAHWGPPVPPEADDATPPDFSAQCEAMHAASPPTISSIRAFTRPSSSRDLRERASFGLPISRRYRRRMPLKLPARMWSRPRALKPAGIVVVLRPLRLSGNRSACSLCWPPSSMRFVVPVVATGGIGDARGVAAALILGASAAQIGTGFLGCPEARTHPAWAAALAETAPEGTIVSRVFSGRAGAALQLIMSAPQRHECNSVAVEIGNLGGLHEAANIQQHGGTHVSKRQKNAKSRVCGINRVRGGCRVSKLYTSGRPTWDSDHYT